MNDEGEIDLDRNYHPRLLQQLTANDPAQAEPIYPNPEPFVHQEWQRKQARSELQLLTPVQALKKRGRKAQKPAPAQKKVKKVKKFRDEEDSDIEAYEGEISGADKSSVAGNNSSDDDSRPQSRGSKSSKV